MEVRVLNELAIEPLSIEELAFRLGVRARFVTMVISNLICQSQVGVSDSMEIRYEIKEKGRKRVE